MLERYMKNYKKGSHCASTSLMNLCGYYGLNLSEDMCFGLGQALGFSFYKNEIMNAYSFSGRSRDIDRNFFEALGIDVVMRCGQNNEAVWSEINHYVNEKEIPVLVKLDIDSLKYLKEYFRLNRNIEQSEHLAVIIGIEEDNVYISEYYQKEPIRITKDELFSGINKKFEEKAISNVYYVIERIPQDINYKTCIKYAIFKNVHQMQYGFGSNLGIPGLIKFVHDIKIIHNSMEKEQFNDILLMAALSFEKIGTGGGNFRRIYARFLRECACILNIKGLKDISDTYVLLAKEWKELSKYLEKYANLEERNEEIFDVICSRLVNILENETNGILKLNEYSHLQWR